MKTQGHALEARADVLRLEATDLLNLVLHLAQFTRTEK